MNPNVVALNEFQTGQLTQAIEAKALNRAFLQNEVARLAERTSTRSDIEQAALARLNTTSLDLVRLTGAREAVATRPEGLADDATVSLTGRARDPNGVGLIDGEVRLADRDGAVIDGIPPARTDTNGGFTINIPRERAEELSDQLDGQATLVVRPRDGEQTVSDTLPFSATGRTVPDIRIDRPVGNPVIITPATRPTGTITQPLSRPVLNSAARPAATSGRVGDLIRSSRTSRVRRGNNS